MNEKMLIAAIRVPSVTLECLGFLHNDVECSVVRLPRAIGLHLGRDEYPELAQAVPESRQKLDPVRGNKVSQKCSSNCHDYFSAGDGE
jgi:hypothetical protein